MSTPDTTPNTPAQDRIPQATHNQSTSTASTPASSSAAAPAESGAKSASAGPAGRIMVWLSVALAVATWCTLLWGNGIVAAVLAVVGIVLGAIGHHRSHALALRRLAVTAIIAQLVPAIVVLAYVLVLHFIVV